MTWRHAHAARIHWNAVRAHTPDKAEAQAGATDGCECLQLSQVLPPEVVDEGHDLRVAQGAGVHRGYLPRMAQPGSRPYAWHAREAHDESII